MTAKQKRFVEEYLIDLNATQAAIRAGYSPATAQEQGYQLLQKTSVQNAINMKIAERSKRTGINADRVIREIAKIAFVNAADLIDFDTATIDSNAVNDDTAAIQSVKVKYFGEDGLEREIKLADKLKALELLGKHLGLFKENIELTGDVKTEMTNLAAILEQMNGAG